MSEDDRLAAIEKRLEAIEDIVHRISMRVGAPTQIDSNQQCYQQSAYYARDLGATKP